MLVATLLTQNLNFVTEKSMFLCLPNFYQRLGYCEHVFQKYYYSYVDPT